MAEEEPDEPTEGESEESSPPEESAGEESAPPEEEPSEASDDELTPEELAEEVLNEESDPSDDPSEDPPPADDESEAEEPAPDELADEVLEDLESGEAADDQLSPEELAEEVLGEGDEPPESDEGQASAEDEPEDTEEELSPEELAEEVLQEEGEETEAPAEPGETPEETAEAETDDEAEESEPQDLSPEDLAEEVLEEEEEDEPDEPPEPGGEEASPQGEEPEDADEETTPGEEPDPAGDEDAEEAGRDEPVAGGEPPESDAADDDEGGASIQDMLEEEAKRSREREDEEEEEEELPEGYMTVEQLPEQEEFEIPEWMKTAGWVSLWLLAVGLVIWYLAMPLWETYLMNQMKGSIERKNYEEARSWARTGLFLNGIFIKNDGPFLADYLQQLLHNEKFEEYRDAYQELSIGLKTPTVQQTYVEYLLNRGRWEEALQNAASLQRWVRTRGMGYLFHAKAALELGDYELARSDLNQVTNWMQEHPASKRVLRDIYFRQGEYRNALQVSNELRSLAESDPWRMKVEDYVRLAQINKKLDKRRVAQQMLERALQRNPVHKEALHELSRQYLLEGRWQRAEPLINGSDYREGFRTLYPFDGFGWWAGAELALSEGNVSRSIRYVERAVDLEPRNPEAHRVKGTIYLDHLEQPAQAVRSYEQARQLGLRRLSFYNKLGQAYYRSSQYSAAARTFERLKSAVGDTHPALIYNIGSAYLGAGEFQKAREHITRAFNQGFKNQKSYNQWGLLLELEGRTQEALAKYFEGIEWGRKNNEPVDLVQNNLDRAFSKENPTPLSEWLAPLSTNYEFSTWKQLESPSNPLGE